MGTLFVITGPSGAGKDSVLNKVHDLGQKFGCIVTTTTRGMRTGESEGHPYYFMSRPDFEQKIAGKQMAEWAEVYGNLYGSTTQEVEDVLSGNEVVAIRVDPQGARSFKKIYPNCVTIFILPPSFELLEKRLINRATDSEEIIKKRLILAKKELENLLDWDYLVVNEDGKLADAAREVMDIIAIKTNNTEAVDK